MRVTFKDFYGQFVTVHNETASGNVRLEVKTFENMNDLQGRSEAECPIITDIALDESRLRILLGALQSMEAA